MYFRRKNHESPIAARIRRRFQSFIMRGIVNICGLCRTTCRTAVLVLFFGVASEKTSRGRSPFWICCYTSAIGQRLQKSTKITVKPFKGEKCKDGSLKTAADKRTEALEACLAIERAENHAKLGTLTEQQAKKIIGEILERTTGEPLRNYKVRDWLDHWLENKRASAGWQDDGSLSSSDSRLHRIAFSRN